MWVLQVAWIADIPMVVTDRGVEHSCYLYDLDTRLILPVTESVATFFPSVDPWV